MFGLGKKDKENEGELSFDLENELKDVAALRKLQKQSDERVMTLKKLLREGDEKKEFDAMQTLLHGYLALNKVVQRVNKI